MNKNTIAAISTPIGVGGISIIRISGEEALMISSKTCSVDLNNLKPRYMNFVKIKTESFSDIGFFIFFKAPKSFTGEDMVELQVHGGTVVAESILKELIKNGAKLADPGEFTKRAFLNNKLTLDKAEGVIDMINSTTISQAKAGYSLLSGKLYKKTKDIQEKIKFLLAEIEAIIDYPEYDIEEREINEFIKILEKSKKEIKELIDTSAMGMIVKNGINVAIIGKPNVGKSSLLNAMLNYDRAIVTSVEGTTRDTLQESYLFKGININITDTAGIRESSDEVEKIGIERSKNIINQSDIVLFIIDGSEKEIDRSERELYKIIKDKKHIVVQNKMDVSENKIVKDAFLVSAEKDVNISELKELIYKKVVDEKIIESDVLITNQRHLEKLKEAYKSTDEAVKLLKNKTSLDIVAIDIKDAWLNMGEISGEVSNEEIINTIFNKFCLGK